MFKAMKSGGFNFEDTHLTDPNRLAKLIALVSVAFLWVYRSEYPGIQSPQSRRKTWSKSN